MLICLCGIIRPNLKAGDDFPFGSNEVLSENSVVTSVSCVWTQVEGPLCDSYRQECEAFSSSKSKKALLRGEVKREREWKVSLRHSMMACGCTILLQCLLVAATGIYFILPLLLPFSISFSVLNIGCIWSELVEHKYLIASVWRSRHQVDTEYKRNE